MSYGDIDQFKVISEHFTTYSDGTTVPHLEIGVWRNAVYRGYLELHTHRVSDDSISVGFTSRFDTERKP